MSPRRRPAATAPTPRPSPWRPCPCGSDSVKVIIPGNPSVRPGYGPIAWPMPTRVYCSIACATVEGWPWLTSEAGKPRGKPRPKMGKPDAAKTRNARSLAGERAPTPTEG